MDNRTGHLNRECEVRNTIHPTGLAASAASKRCTHTNRFKRRTFNVKRSTLNEAGVGVTCRTARTMGVSPMESFRWL
jgi:hypothetical protein